MDAMGWRRQIGKAVDAAAVLHVLRSFIGALDATEAAALPAELRNSPPRTAEDVSCWALRITRAWLDSGAVGRNSSLSFRRASLAFRAGSRCVAGCGEKRAAPCHPGSAG